MIGARPKREQAGNVVKDVSKAQSLRWYDVPLSTKWWLFSGVIAILIGSVLIQTVVDMMYARAATPSYTLAKRFGHGNYFTNPSDIASTPDGGFAVLHGGSGTTRMVGVAKFDASGNLQFRIPSSQISGPDAITTDSSGNLYVMDGGWGYRTSHRLQKFDANGNVVSTVIYQNGAAAGQLGYVVAAMAVDDQGNVYVTEDSTWGSQGVRLQKFDASGNFIKRIGTEGGGAGQFYGKIRSIVVSGTTLYVADNWSE